MKRSILLAVLAAPAAALAFAACSTEAKTDPVKRGEYLVNAMGCNDCHTPWKPGPNGPEMDMSRRLSGHPASLELPPAPQLPPGPWIAAVAGTFTAWSGPWGTSFPANLTPDPETGLGKWTYDDFANTMRTGRHHGRGRPLLPPMPYFNLAALTETDLQAVFAYLRSLPAIQNRVPEPLPPAR